jgi:hypothetical protein
MPSGTLIRLFPEGEVGPKVGELLRPLSGFQSQRDCVPEPRVGDAATLGKSIFPFQPQGGNAMRKRARSKRLGAWYRAGHGRIRLPSVRLRIEGSIASIPDGSRSRHKPASCALLQRPASRNRYAMRTRQPRKGCRNPLRSQKPFTFI